MDDLQSETPNNNLVEAKLVNCDNEIPVSSKQKQVGFLAKFSKYNGVVFALLSAFFTGLSIVLFKKANFFNGSEQSALRFIAQLCVGIPVSLYKNISLLGPRDKRFILSIRGIFGAVAIIAGFSSFRFINPSDASALVNTNIIFVSVIARFFLNEKFTMAHLVALFCTVVGILLIAQPSFLFKATVAHVVASDYSVANIMMNNMSNLSGNSLNSTQQNILNTKYVNIEPEGKSEHKLLGVGLSLLCAFTVSMTMVFLKKLTNANVHFSLILNYASYWGLLCSLAVSLIFLLTGIEQKDPKDLQNFSYILNQIVIVTLAGFISVLGQISLNFSFVYDDASKVSLFKSTDLFFIFFMQFLMLNIYPNLLNTIGALSIFAGIVIILIYKMLDDKYHKLKNKKLNTNIPHKETAFRKLLHYKF